MAVGVAISPVPIIALILMLFTKRATSNSLSFAAGWVIGAVFIALGVKQWAGRPAPDEEAVMPAWMSTIDA